MDGKNTKLGRRPDDIAHFFFPMCVVVFPNFSKHATRFSADFRLERWLKGQTGMWRKKQKWKVVEPMERDLSVVNV